MHRFWLGIAVATACYGQWPSPKTAVEAYDFVQQRRAEAEKLWHQDDLRGIEMLVQTLRFLDQPLIRDLSAGNR